MEIVAKCPRCGANRMTLDVPAVNPNCSVSHGWQHWFEVYGICRECHRSSIHVVSQREAGDEDKRIARALAGGEKPKLVGDSLSRVFKIEDHITLKDEAGVAPPDHVPDGIAAVFREGATCCVVGCWNAAGAMFRLCVDLATKARLPHEGDGNITKYQRSKLAPRLAWLFENKLLPADLEPLSTCIREDGNDAAHDGSLNEADALDLQDFCVELLERVYTVPGNLKLAQTRRADRRQPKQEP